LLNASRRLLPSPLRAHPYSPSARLLASSPTRPLLSHCARGWLASTPC